MPAIRISNLSKSYTIAHDRQRASNLGEAVMQKLRNPLRRSTTETFWALKDIDLDIEQGDVVGIIGRNGAGKSTLLKILSRITEPTSGRIELFGRVGALLEVGTGFHPELTGRENIFLNGAILGMRRPEIRKQFDAIVDFAGVEKFLDTPVKRYSSGMYVRLAFAVAAHLRSDILIVDEVLAVGDAEFQKKCLGKMKDVASSGRTVLFVSHNMGAVRAMCDRCILLSQGRLLRIGEVAEIAALYAESAFQEQEAVFGQGKCVIDFTNLSEPNLAYWPADHQARFSFSIDRLEYGHCWAFDVAMYSDSGIKLCVFQSDRMLFGGLKPIDGRILFELTVTNPGFATDTISIDVGARFIGAPSYLVLWKSVFSCSVEPRDVNLVSSAGEAITPLALITCKTNG